jgi:hypothetical protein
MHHAHACRCNILHSPTPWLLFGGYGWSFLHTCWQSMIITCYYAHSGRRPDRRVWIAAVTGKHAAHGSEVKLLHADCSGPIFCPCTCSTCCFYTLGAPSTSCPSTDEQFKPSLLSLSFRMPESRAPHGRRWQGQASVERFWE